MRFCNNAAFRKAKIKGLLIIEFPPTQHIALILRPHPTTITCENRCLREYFASEQAAELYCRRIQQLTQRWREVIKIEEVYFKEYLIYIFAFLIGFIFVISDRELMGHLSIFR